MNKETEQLKGSGTIFTRIMLNERKDLFDLCPEQVKAYIILRDEAEKYISSGYTDEGRKILNTAYKILIGTKENENR